MAEVITVTALNQYVKTLLDSNDVLYDLALRGEIFNFTRNSKSGHCYFTLRDTDCSVKAVMFSRDAGRLAFRPEDGMRVVVRCRVSLYVQAGTFQVYVSDMFPDGLGSAQLALEQLKRKLYAEGLFSPEHKKPLPAQPHCIGVITSKTGAALQDIKNVLSRRWPLAKVLLYPVTVQGFEAAQQVSQAIDWMSADGRADVIIVARGGGSREDLWVFNAEIIARAAFRCKIPIVSAIGHEIDTTVLDYVADCRAPTPSAAAELVVPDQYEVRREICMKWQNMHENMQTKFALCYNRFADLALDYAKNPCRDNWKKKQDFLLDISNEIVQAATQKQLQCVRRLQHLAALSETLNPQRVLTRGYTVVLDREGHYRKLNELSPGDKICVVGNGAAADCVVETVEEIV